LSYKSRGNYQVNVCLKSDCVNRDFVCHSCIRFSLYSTSELHSSITDACTKSISPVSQQGPVVDTKGNKQVLSSYQKNELYRKARDLKLDIEKGLCSKTESRIPTDKNVQKMIHSEFKIAPKIDEYKKIMKAIGADPKDYNTERLRRR